MMSNEDEEVEGELLGPGPIDKVEFLSFLASEMDKALKTAQRLETYDGDVTEELDYE